MANYNTAKNLFRRQQNSFSDLDNAVMLNTICITLRCRLVGNNHLTSSLFTKCIWRSTCIFGVHFSKRLQLFCFVPILCMACNIFCYLCQNPRRQQVPVSVTTMTLASAPVANASDVVLASDSLDTTSSLTNASHSQVPV